MDPISSSDIAMEQILKELLEIDVTITVREVARRHPNVKHASSFTRISWRREMIQAFQTEQDARRQWRARTQKRSGKQLSAELAKKDMRIAELERQVEVLRVSHLVMIRAVGEMGGMSKLLKLYESYSGVRQELARMGALPTAEVKQFELPQLVQTD